MWLSVIIPTYQRAKLVSRAVASVLDQAHTVSKPVEVIVVDDGSTDDTIKSLSHQFQSKIVEGALALIPKRHQGDPGINRNIAAKKARGEFLAFLDSDDYWKPGRLGQLSTALITADFVASARPALPTDGDILRHYLSVNPTFTSTVAMRRSLFFESGGVPEGYYGLERSLFVGCEDYELWLNALLLLDKRGEIKRAQMISDEFVFTDLGHGGIGRQAIKTQMRRELATMLRMLVQVPAKYKPLVLRRIAGATKASLFG